MQRRVLPGFGPALGFSGACVGLIVLLPPAGLEEALPACRSRAQPIAAA